MRKLIPGVVIIVFTVLASLLIMGIIRKIQNQKYITEKISKLPSFSFKRVTKGLFSSSEIKGGPVLIVHFHPECEHCRYEISEIMKSGIPASGTKVILISSAHPDSITKFLSQYNLPDFPSIISLADTAYLFGDIFGSERIPSNYIYNKELKLVKVVHGEVNTGTILKYLPDSE